MSGSGLLAGTPGHGEALMLGATRLLAAGRPRDAFALADRRCRLAFPPPASALALRALALWLMDAKGDAVADLARAIAGDPSDPVVALAALQLSLAGADMPDPSPLVVETATAHDLLRLGLERLLREGRRTVARLDCLDGQVTGWVVWSGEATGGADSLILTLHGEAGERRHVVTPEPGFGLAPPGAKGAFLDLTAPGAPRRWTLGLPGVAGGLAQGSLWPRSGAPVSSPGAAAPSRIPQRRPITILVPVYEDFEATQDCLRAAVAARTEDVRVLVVDDASPNRRLRLLLDALAARGMIDLLRNEHNLGFAGAVNRGLAATVGADVLVLNSDAVLPPGALRRMAEVAYRDAAIGSVTPLSNQGEFASFPARSDRARVPSPEEARAIDAVAASRPEADPADLPSGTGFCLFVRHDALGAVRAFSSLFGRGYFEDLDLCLRLRAKGFRNVAAPGIFVPHAGSRSFSDDRAALVARNRRLAARRHPAHRDEAKAFASADPLHAARSRIEAALAPPSGRRLVVFRQGDASAEEHLLRLERNEAAWIVLEWRPAGNRLRFRFRAGDEGVLPQSLEFDTASGFDDAADDSTRDAWRAPSPFHEPGWRPYLQALAPDAVDLVGHPPPAPLLAALADVAAPLDWLVEGPDAPALIAPFTAAPSPFWRDLLVADEGTRTLLERDTSLSPKRIGVVQSSRFPLEAALRATLGLLLPVPGPRADGFVRDLSAALRRVRPEALICVLGRAMDDACLFGLGNVFVSGRVASNEWTWLVRHLAPTALALPPGLPGFALLERLSAETGLPSAVCDPAGRSSAPAPHLFMDPTARDRDNAHALVDWFAHRLAPPPT